jgi:hypothetical protein
MAPTFLPNFPLIGNDAGQQVAPAVLHQRQQITHGRRMRRLHFVNHLIFVLLLLSLFFPKT